MNVSLPNLLKALVLLCAGFVFGLLALSAVSATNLKNMLAHKLGFAGSKQALADNACTTPAVQKDESYFVSCGGFF